MSDSNKNKEEEVDLGSLFIIIGKGFSKIFKFIENIFLGLFDFLIQLLLFIKGNVLKLGIAILVGGILGFILDYISVTVYKSEMVVKPNYGSVKQLYTNIEYFNNLAKQKNKDKLITLFNLSAEEANSLKSFEIKPVEAEKDILDSYSNIVSLVDTLASKNYTYKKFKESFEDVDYYYHLIKIKSVKNGFFDKFNNTILKSITDNDYFKTIQKITLENIDRSERVYRKDLIQVDSLRKLYAKVLLEEAKKTVSGTTINTGRASSLGTPKEIQLFETSNSLNKSLREVNIEKSEKSEIVNIVSSFQNIGSKAGDLFSKNYVRFAALGGILMLLFLLFAKLNSFLKNYKKAK